MKTQDPTTLLAIKTLDDEASGVSLAYDRVLEILEKGGFDEEHGSIRWSSNYTFLISITHKDDTVMAVYKPRSGERPLWDFPDGTLCQRERATYITAQTLNWRVIPPTVLREGPRGVGSVQFFVDHDPNYNYFSFDNSLLPQLMRLSLFDVLINNADRKGGHCLVDNDDHLWGIDHGITFHSANKLRTVIWNFAGQPIPEHLMTDIKTLCEQLDDPQASFVAELEGLLSRGEVTAFRHRVQRIVKTGKYPEPGPGPNYPWPPV